MNRETTEFVKKDALNAILSASQLGIEIIKILAGEIQVDYLTQQQTQFLGSCVLSLLPPRVNGNFKGLKENPLNTDFWQVEIELPDEEPFFLM